MKHTNSVHVVSRSNDKTPKPHHAAPAADVADVAHDLSTATAPREQKAFAKMLPLARGIPADEILQVNLDLPTTASTCVVAVAHRLGPFREFFAGLRDFRISAFDELEAVGLALAVAHADYRAAISPPDAITALVDKGTALRATFELWGKAFADAGLLDATVPEALHTGTSYRDLAIALVGWARAFRDANWAKLKATSALTDDLLTEAETLSQRILAVVGYRDLNPERISAAADIRARMFTLAVQLYDEVTRGVTYMRWHFGDAAEFAPSLYAKGPRKIVAEPEPTSATSPSPTTTATAAAPVAAPTPPAAQHVGMPDSSPFTKE